MAKDIFSKFDKNIDTAGLKEDIQKAAENGGDFEQVPPGLYEVEVDTESVELTESKSEKPMVKIWFTILAGDRKGQKIFYYQVVEKGFQIHLVNELLRSLDFDIDFESYADYAERLEAFAEYADGLEFALEVGENKKGFRTYKVTEIF